MSLSKNLKRWLRYIVVLVIVLYLCWQNSGASGRLTQGVCDVVSDVMEFFGGERARTITTDANFYMIVRKSGHGLAFMALAFCGHLAIDADATTRKARNWSSLGLNLGMALIAEILQAYVAARTPTTRDAVINLAGATLGILFAAIVAAVQRRIDK